MKIILYLIVSIIIIQCKPTTALHKTNENIMVNNSVEDTIPRWTVYALGEPNMQYWNARKVIAIKWGIPYEIEFGGCVVGPKTTKRNEEMKVENKATFIVLEEKFGKNWLEKFNKEADELIKSKDTIPTWTVYALGKPNMQYWNARKEIAKKWGIPYEIEFGGCVVGPKTTKRNEEIKVENKATFLVLEEKFGKDWLEKFHKEADELIKSQNK